MIKKESSKIKAPLKAIALGYKSSESMPTVIASGQDELARLIVEIARSSDIPIQENKELVSLLEKQKPGPILSPRALKVLAEVIAFLYQSDKLWKEKQALAS